MRSQSLRHYFRGTVTYQKVYLNGIILRGGPQRVLNVLQTTRLLAVVCMIWLLAPLPAPPPPSSKLDRCYTQEYWERDTTCWREGDGKGVVEEPNHMTARSLVLYKSFSISLVPPHIIVRLSVYHFSVWGMVPANFLTFKEPKNRFQWTISARLYTCSLASRYDNPIPVRFLAPIDCSKIPALGPRSYSKCICTCDRSFLKREGFAENCKRVQKCGLIMEVKPA